MEHRSTPLGYPALAEVHEPWPSSSVNAPAESTKEPALASLQLDCSDASWNEPAVHSEHSEAPAPAE